VRPVRLFQQKIFSDTIGNFLGVRYNFIHCGLVVKTRDTMETITKNFCVLHNTVEHNYISPSGTVGIQLHVSALYVGHLQVVT
jgi:hypothetical protein